MDLYGGAHDAFKWMPDPPGTGGAHGEYRGGKGDRPGTNDTSGAESAAKSAGDGRGNHKRSRVSRLNRHDCQIAESKGCRYHGGGNRSDGKDGGLRFENCREKWADCGTEAQSGPDDCGFHGGAAGSGGQRDNSGLACHKGRVKNGKGVKSGWKGLYHGGICDGADQRGDELFPLHSGLYGGSGWVPLSGGRLRGVAGF